MLLNLRVSTDRQARNDLSRTDQMNQLRARCERAGWQVRGGTRRIPRPLAEERVVEALLDRLPTPVRIIEILTRVKARRDGRQESAERRLTTSAAELAEAELRMTRIYAPIEVGTVDVADPTLKVRITTLGAEEDRLREALD